MKSRPDGRLFRTRFLLGRSSARCATCSGSGGTRRVRGRIFAPLHGLAQLLADDIAALSLGLLPLVRNVLSYGLSLLSGTLGDFGLLGDVVFDTFGSGQFAHGFYAVFHGALSKLELLFGAVGDGVGYDGADLLHALEVLLAGRHSAGEVKHLLQIGLEVLGVLIRIEQFGEVVGKHSDGPSVRVVVTVRSLRCQNRTVNAFCASHNHPTFRIYR